MLIQNMDEIEIVAVKAQTKKKIAEKTVEIVSRPSGHFGNPRRYRLQIAEDVIDAAAFKAGDKVYLGKVKSASIWVLIPTGNPDGLMIRQNGRQFFIDNMDMVAKLHTAADADLFDAWADDCRIYFKPKG